MLNILSYFKLITLFSRSSKDNLISTTEKYVLGLEFEDHMRFVSERWDIEKHLKLEICR